MQNRTKLLSASFLTLIAAGVGFMVRNGGVLGEWAAAFGFTKTELGTITGGGLAGFGLVVLGASLITDRVGYKIILVTAFVCHLISAVIMLSATSVFHASGREATYWCLYLGTFIFAVGNGLCEAAINPLITTLYPHRKTHYLNLVHAGWPGGLVLGGVLAYLFVGQNAKIVHLRWEIPMAMFLMPAFIYGFILLRERFPVSEVRAAGITFVEMLKEFARPILLLLLFLQALIGYVELGTDSWIVEIMKPVIRGEAVLLIIYTSMVMFVLRFFAGPIVHRINPIGLLLVSSMIGCCGLYFLASAQTGWMILLMGTVYAVGKAFLWPTMLGAVGELFPKGGAVTMGAVGAIGTLSAGLVAGPIIGYQQDYYASARLESESPAAYQRYRSENPTRFLLLPKVVGLDGAKVATLMDQGQALSIDVQAVEARGEALPSDSELKKLYEWWQIAETNAGVDKQPVEDATVDGGRAALRWTSLVPLLMAGGYLILVIYFRMQGGYRIARLDPE